MDLPAYRRPPVHLRLDNHTAVSNILVGLADGPLATSYANEAVEDWSRSASKPRSSLDKAQLKVVLAVLASVTAVILLILICKSVRSRPDSWVGKRKLSADRDVSGSEPGHLAICEASDEEIEDGPKPPSPRVPLSTHRPKKAKLKAHGEPGATHSSTEKDESTLESDDDQSTTSVGRRHKRRARVSPSGSLVGKGGQQTSSDEALESSSKSEQELEAASALLSLHYSLAALAEAEASPSEPAAEPEAPSPPSLPTSAPIPVRPASVDSFRMAASSAVWLMPQPTAAFTTFAPIVLPPASSFSPETALNVEASGASALSANSKPSSNAVAQSASSALQAAASSAGPLGHPYYRIPEVDPAHQAVRRFNPDLTTSAQLVSHYPINRLQVLRRLLAEPQLGPSQLDELAVVTAQVLANVYYGERESTLNKKLSYATAILGRRFMFLDTSIAALEVLGERAAGPWWNEIMRVIPDDSTRDLSSALERRYAAGRFHAGLLSRLSDALQTLRRGVRLYGTETIELKRLLFFSPSSPTKFKLPRWMPWRQDDKDFGEHSSLVSQKK